MSRAIISVASCWFASGSNCYSIGIRLSGTVADRGRRSEYEVGGGNVAGIGVVSGVECLVSGNDPTVRGGTINPYSVKKTLRAFDICEENRLPHVTLVESGGADLPRQSEIFIPGGATFRRLTQLSKAGIPTIALVFGNSTAGGAYMPAMCDYSVFVKGGAKVFLGGPPLVKMATGEESTDEELGGAEMHSRVSGLSDYLAVDERDALRIGRQIVANLNWKKFGPPPDEWSNRRVTTTKIYSGWHHRI